MKPCSFYQYIVCLNLTKLIKTHNTSFITNMSKNIINNSNKIFMNIKQMLNEEL